MCVCEHVCNCVYTYVHNLGREPYPQFTHRHQTYMPTPPKLLILQQHQNAQPPLPTTQHHVTLLVHRAPQLIPDPDPNLLLGHHITQPNVQSSQLVHATQTGWNGAADKIAPEGPDATARGASVVVVR